jgi:hypothetical protein
LLAAGAPGARVPARPLVSPRVPAAVVLHRSSAPRAARRPASGQSPRARSLPRARGAAAAAARAPGRRARQGGTLACAINARVLSTLPLARAEHPAEHPACGSAPCSTPAPPSTQMLMLLHPLFLAGRVRSTLLPRAGSTLLGRVLPSRGYPRVGAPPSRLPTQRLPPVRLPVTRLLTPRSRFVCGGSQART